MASQAALFLVGCVFWAESVLSGSAFTEDVWGALAFSVPAIFWAGINMGSSAITLVGLIKPVKNWKIVAGATISSLQYMILSWSAIFDGGAAVIGMYALIFFLPLHLWLIFEAATYDPR